MKTWT